MFIVFEGIDGCGKSTQFKKFHEYIYNFSKYNHILSTREPYKSKEIREILKQDEDPYSKAKQLTELFIKDREEHIKELIKPNIDKSIILCDRYKYSTICYQTAQGLDINWLAELHNDMPTPDLTFIFDVPIETAFRRMKKDSRITEQKFEKDRDFLEKVRKNYIKIKDIFPNENIILLNGDQSVEAIFNEMQKYFLQTFKNKK